MAAERCDSTGLGVHRRVPHGGSSRDNSREVATLLAVSTRLAQHGFWISRPTLWSGLLDVADTTGSAQVALVMLALIVWGILLRRQQPLPPQPMAGYFASESAPRTIALLAALAVGPIAIGFIVSQISTPIFISRYISCALPASAVLSGHWRGKTSDDTEPACDRRAPVSGHS